MPLFSYYLNLCSEKKSQDFCHQVSESSLSSTNTVGLSVESDFLKFHLFFLKLFFIFKK